MDIFETENEFGKGVVKSWASILDDNAREQAEAISRVSIMDGHLALMPDAHFGFGPPVGSALKTRDAIMPYAVGVDIGCGMIAVKTTLDRNQLKGSERHILGHIRDLIPSGVGKSHHTPLPAADEFIRQHGLPPGIESESQLERKGKMLADDFQALKQRLMSQFGTLGAGNHFVEVCTTDDGTVWLLLHSGSRGIGNILATAHVKIAKTFCRVNNKTAASRKRTVSTIISLESNEFAYLVAGTDEFDAYIDDMLWCQQYAYAQREAMMNGLIEAVSREVGTFEIDEPINCHHNYAEEIEPGLWLTRKGAIDASPGKLGIIPGSMGAATYIVRGRGNAESYNTAPHGAGRIMGRGVARRTLELDEFKRQMQGRVWLDRDAEKLLDEAPNAYKPIEQVIADSSDLLDVQAVLTQFINYKGVK